MICDRLTRDDPKISAAFPNPAPTPAARTTSALFANSVIYNIKYIEDYLIVLKLQ
jgi:hypothetical protein